MKLKKSIINRLQILPNRNWLRKDIRVILKELSINPEKAILYLDVESATIQYACHMIIENKFMSQLEFNKSRDKR